MNATPLSASKKCPHCGQWSGHRQQPADRCEHCHELLDPQGPRKEAEMEKAWKWEMPQVMLITISPTDPWYVRLAKYVVRSGQMLFMATLSFILWLVTVLAG